MSLRSLLLLLVLAVAPTVLFWSPLWQGSGLIGGDLYSYFFPQKIVYADQLAEGRLPLWNRLVGFGYPLLAESQTGVLYPLNPLLYRLFPVNTAYNISQLTHYVLAFVFAWLLMRRLDLSRWGATLAAVVFVYGWFPPRICLEWAIIGGVYLPLSLWCTESYLLSGRRGWLLGLAAALGLHLLAGHFNLAFINQLTLLTYTMLRAAFVKTSSASAQRNGRTWLRGVLPVTLAIAGGFALASVQLLPTWELKQLSQREEIGRHHDPGYGHIPPWYLSQIVAPWLWYAADSDPDQALNAIKMLSIPSATNKVEAHLYFGLLPLGLIVWRLGLVMRGDPLGRRLMIWLLLGLAAMAYATGWLLPVTRQLPGFRFFMGPGRYGIVTTLAAALLSGAGLDRLISQGKETLPLNRGKMNASAIRPTGGSFARAGSRQLLAAAIVGLTLADLYWVSRRVTYAVMVDDPPIAHREKSEVRRVLAEYQSAGSGIRPVRMWAPGANVASLTGFPATPAYLGLGPAAYFDPELTMPQPQPDDAPAQRRAAAARQREWLRSAAVTHILRMDRLDPQDWPDARLVWAGLDRLLNPAWGRYREPLFLYEFSDPGSFARLDGGQPGDEATVVSLEADTVAIETVAQTTGVRLTIAQLNYPGWCVTIDGAELARTADGEFLSVDVPPGRHRVEWRYSPVCVWWGAIVSLAAWIGLAVAAGVLQRVRLTRTGDGPAG